ncbi:MAG: DNA adenine methylase [Gemmatimonadales bacterium]|nr:DNA adenine methylase [Gemmatimonadales bacterium]
MIKYLGSKRRLVPRIVVLVSAIPGARTVLDLFTGSTRVAQGLKRAGFHVTANDLASYSEVLATAYIATDAARAPVADWAAKLEVLDRLPDVRGYVTRTFCEEARYFQPANGQRIDAIRAGIDRVAESPAERAVLLTALLEAADRVDSTTGLQMAYLKSWAPRSHRPLVLRMPELLRGPGVATRADAGEFVAAAGPFDVAYLDPPYNQHSYYSNYHIWETLVRGDAPEAYGIARKREDCRSTKSAFNQRPRAWDALRAVVEGVNARHLLLSFSNEGFFTDAEIRRLLDDRFGEVAVIPVDSPRYVGARIGIHNPKGERVGAVSHVRNTELLFLAGPDAQEIADASGARTMGAALTASGGR